MGADRLSAFPGGTCYRTNRPKIIRHGEILIGCAGTTSFQNIIESCEIPEFGHLAAHEDLVLRFVPWFLEELSKRGKLGKDNDGETLIDGELLIACPGPGLFHIDAGGAVDQWDCCYMAVGSGSREAMASLFSTFDLSGGNISWDDKIRIALEAAATFRVDVAPPFDILTTPQDGEG